MCITYLITVRYYMRTLTLLIEITNVYTFFSDKCEILNVYTCTLSLITEISNLYTLSLKNCDILSIPYLITVRY